MGLFPEVIFFFGGGRRHLTQICIKAILDFFSPHNKREKENRTYIFEYVP